MKTVPLSAKQALLTSIQATPFTQLDAALALKVSGMAGLEARMFNIVPELRTLRNTGNALAPVPPVPALGGYNFGPAVDKVRRGYSGGLGDAISQELKHKPPGSNLVIANSSETVIPAAGGLGMKDFMHTLDTGFNRVAGTVNASMGRGGYSGSGHVTNHISITQQPGQNPEELAAIVAMRIGEAVAEARSASIFI
jgi:hypothetical protein